MSSKFIIRCQVKEFTEENRKRGQLLMSGDASCNSVTDEGVTTGHCDGLANGR